MNIFRRHYGFFFSVNRTTNQIAFTACETGFVQLGDKQAVIYDQVISNIGGGYEQQDGHFIAPITGLYTFTFTGMSHHKEGLFLNFVKNGAVVAKLYASNIDASSSTQVVHVHLEVSDRVWINNGGPSGQHLHDTYNCFSGILNTIG